MVEDDDGIDHGWCFAVAVQEKVNSEALKRWAKRPQVLTPTFAGNLEFVSKIQKSLIKRLPSILLP